MSFVAAGRQSHEGLSLSIFLYLSFSHRLSSTECGQTYVACASAVRMVREWFVRLDEGETVALQHVRSTYDELRTSAMGIV